MSNLPLKALNWSQKSLNPLAELELTAYSALHEYVITEPKQGKFEIKKTRLGEPDKKSEYMTGFTSVKDAQDEAWNHYNEKMQPYVNADSITDIANWFKAAKPEPTDKDIGTQTGCLLEEVVELLEGLGFAKHGVVLDIHNLANLFKANTFNHEIATLTEEQRIEVVDACCDINVTSVGVMQLLGGVDALGAQREVIRSNNSKMVKGKFEYDENGKMKKGESYSKPDLTPFVKQGE